MIWISDGAPWHDMPDESFSIDLSEIRLAIATARREAMGWYKRDSQSERAKQPHLLRTAAR